jgi:hypothetical protein
MDRVADRLRGLTRRCASTGDYRSVQTTTFATDRWVQRIPQ